MDSDHNRKPQSHLINILRTTKDHHPNFVLLLGAGASKTSGVKLASEMIEDWRDCYYQMYGKGADKEEFWRSVYWHKQPEEYSMLFEALYDQPSQRREFIESCVAQASPSWGYIYLVNQLKKKVFNTIFTTNFDDLVNEACYLFSDTVRPIVCAHDSSIRSVRLSSPRPKIIKLHGDFLFDNIKNTLAELESLEDNIKAKFKQYATEFGLIVIGYAGNDRSIMDTLGTLLKVDASFPHGVYWCLKKGTKPSPHVEALARFPKFKFVEIEGFDHLFADIQEGLNLELQPEMLDPYASLTSRLNGLIDKVRLPEACAHKLIERDIQAIGHKISRREDQHWDASKMDDLTIKVGDRLLKMSLPFELLAQLEERQSHYKQAIDYLVRAIRDNPNPRVFVKAFELCKNSKCYDRLSELVNLFSGAKDVLVEEPTAANAVALSLIHMERYQDAEIALDLGIELMRRAGAVSSASETIYVLNKLQLKRHQRQKLSDAEEEQLREIIKTGNALMQMGASILLDRFDDAEKYLNAAVKQKLETRDQIETWPITKLLRQAKPIIDTLVIEPPDNTPM